MGNPRSTDQITPLRGFSKARWVFLSTSANHEYSARCGAAFHLIDRVVNGRFDRLAQVSHMYIGYDPYHGKVPAAPFESFSKGIFIRPVLLRHVLVDYRCSR